MTGNAPAAASRPERGADIAVLGLVVMVTWTLVIKYIAPILWYVSERAGGRPPSGVPLMWDFWWVPHLLLAWLLWRRDRRARLFGVLLSAAEIVIVVLKFVLFWRAPDLSFWRLLWFTNKVYVLVYFIVLLVFLLRRGEWPASAAGTGVVAQTPSADALS